MYWICIYGQHHRWPKGNSISIHCVFAHGCVDNKEFLSLDKAWLVSQTLRISYSTPMGQLILFCLSLSTHHINLKRSHRRALSRPSMRCIFQLNATLTSTRSVHMKTKKSASWFIYIFIYFNRTCKIYGEYQSPLSAAASAVCSGRFRELRCIFTLIRRTKAHNALGDFKANATTPRYNNNIEWWALILHRYLSLSTVLQGDWVGECPGVMTLSTAEPTKNSDLY